MGWSGRGRRIRGLFVKTPKVPDVDKRSMHGQDPKEGNRNIAELSREQNALITSTTRSLL